MRKFKIAASSFVTIVLVGLLLLAANSCGNPKREKLQREITYELEKFNKTCPMAFGEYGSLMGASYDKDENKVTYKLTLNEDFMPMKVMRKHKDVMKMLLRKQFSENPALRVFSTNNVTLSYEISGNQSSGTFEVVATPEEMRRWQTEIVDNAEFNKQLIKYQLEVANEALPQQVERGMTMESVALEGSSIVYLCRMNEDLYDIDMFRQVKSEMKKGIVEGTPIDFETEAFFKTIVESNYNLVYRYKGSASGKSLDIVITPEEIQGMIYRSKQYD